MKTIVVGDTHGRSHWKTISEQNNFDKIVFIGDYFDSRDKSITSDIEIKNFKEILHFKENNFNEVTLLYGNHIF